MRKFISTTVLIATVVGFTFLQSCKKATTTDSDTTSVSNHSLTENTTNDVQNISDQAAGGLNTGAYKTDGALGEYSNCSTTVTLDSTSTPNHRKWTVDFGTTACTSLDGRTRSGQILIDVVGNYWTVGSVRTITFNNYFVDGNQVTGTHVVTLTSLSPRTVSVSVNGSIILASNGGTITWVSNRTRTWTSTSMFHVTGSASGTNAAGVAFTDSITSPLVRDLSCAVGHGHYHFVAGIITLTETGHATKTVDFGNGACDLLATLTVNGHKYNFTMR